MFESAFLFRQVAGGAAIAGTERKPSLPLDRAKSAALPPEPVEEADSGGRAEFHKPWIAREFPDVVCLVGRSIV